MIFLYILMAFNGAHAQVGATTDALGGAGVAHANGVESAFLNPASLAFFKDIYVGGAHRFGKTTLGDVRQINAVIADASPSNLFVGSVAYRQRDYERAGQNDIVEREFIVNGAFLLRSNLAVGLKGYKVDTDLGLSRVEQFNGDIGVHWALKPSILLALTQIGVGSTKGELAAPLGVLPETRVGGMVNFSSLISVVADFGFAYNQNPHNRLSHAFGVSLSPREFLKFHLGGRIDDRSRETAYTAGLQFYGPRLKLGYAYQKEVRQEVGEVHTIDISLNL